MSENRIRPKLLRVTPEVDALVRAYAAKEGCTPNEAAEKLIQAPRINAQTGEIEQLKAEIERLRAEIAECVRPYQEEVARLQGELHSVRLKTALPEDLDKRLRERAIAKWQSKEDTIKHVLTVGLNRLDAVENYATRKGAKKG